MRGEREDDLQFDVVNVTYGSDAYHKKMCAGAQLLETHGVGVRGKGALEVKGMLIGIASSTSVVALLTPAGQRMVHLCLCLCLCLSVCLSVCLCGGRTRS